MSPRSSVDGVNFSAVHAVMCTRHGFIGSVPLDGLVACVERHWRAFHRDEGDTAAVEGRDWTHFESPGRCDTCLTIVELPYWVHVSTPPTTVGPIVDADGLWCLCDPCHDLWAARDLSGWTRRHMSMAKEMSTAFDEVPPEIDPAKFHEVMVDMRAMVAQRFRLLFERFDDGTRNTTAAQPRQ